MKSDNRVMAGRQRAFAAQCFQEGFIGIDYGMDINLTGRLPERWKDCNKEFIPPRTQSAYK